MQMPPRFPDVTEAERLGSRVLRPRCARMKEARAAVEGVKDPREAWEALAAREIIPMAWVGAPGRIFRNGWKKSYPPTVEAALRLGSDAEGVLTAEALMRECALRLCELGYAVEPEAPVRWWVVVPSRNVMELTVDEAWWQLGRFARAAVGQNLGLNNIPIDDHTSTAFFRGANGGRALTDPRTGGVTRGAEVVWHFVDAAMRALWSTRGWYLAARDGVTLPEREGRWASETERVLGGGRWAGRAVGEAPDPFEPLLALWATGYAPGVMDDGLGLFALDRAV